MDAHYTNRLDPWQYAAERQEALDAKLNEAEGRMCDDELRWQLEGKMRDD